MRYKYPRTPHMPFSPGATHDDKVLRSLAHFHGREVIITAKRDGENTNLYRKGFHAKSLDGKHHPWQDWVGNWHASFAHDIPEGWRICGENLYALHSIAYSDLSSYFEAFSVWDETNTALDWDASLEIFELLGIEPVPVKWRGLFDEREIHRLTASLDLQREEGLVMRLAGRIPYEDFGQSYAKWVRKDHVQTDEHWTRGPIVPNRLKERT